MDQTLEDRLSRLERETRVLKRCGFVSLLVVIGLLAIVLVGAYPAAAQSSTRGRNTTGDEGGPVRMQQSGWLRL